jgi:hypothetical protein
MNSYWITSLHTPGAMLHYDNRPDAYEAAESHANKTQKPVRIYDAPSGEVIATVWPTR